MHELIWNSDWDTGHPLVDQQHHELFALAQALFKALHRGQETDLQRHLAFLANYVEMHFASEEQAMLQAGYPALAHHRGIHDAMRARVAALEGGQVTDGVLDFIVDWLITHINGEDRAMAAFLCARAQPEGARLAMDFKAPVAPRGAPGRPRK